MKFFEIFSARKLVGAIKKTFPDYAQYGDCSLCGHMWAGHAYVKDLGINQCDECAYEIEHGFPTQLNAICVLPPPIGTITYW